MPKMPNSYEPSLELRTSLPENSWRYETAVAHTKAFAAIRDLEARVAQVLGAAPKKSDIPTFQQISLQLQSTGSAPLVLSGLPNASAANVLVNTWANLPAAGGQNIGDLFWVSDRTVLYQVQSVSGANAWVYILGVMRGTFASLVTGLGTNDAYFRYYVTDYSHTLIWGGATWGPNWPDGDDGSGYYRMYEAAPSGYGASAWQICDGSTVARLNPDGTTTNVTLDNLVTAAYLKGGTSSSAVAAASGKTATKIATNQAATTGLTVVNANLNPTTNKFTVDAGGGTAVTGIGEPHGHGVSDVGHNHPQDTHDHDVGTLELRNKQARLYYRR